MQGKKKTHSEYENDLFEREIDYWPIELYQGSETPILHECLHGHSWSVKPNNVLRGVNCPKCTGNHQKTTKEYADSITIDAIPLEDYVNSYTQMLHQCSRGHKWSSLPRTILSGHGCPKCNLVGGYNKTRFLRDRELAESPGLLYCIVLVNKRTMERECVKIGITKGTSNKDVLKRAKGFKGYEPRIQKEVRGTLEQVFNLEQELHDKWRDFRYLDSHKFPGHTELFEIEKLPEILKSIPTSV